MNTKVIIEDMVTMVIKCTSHREKMITELLINYAAYT